MNRSAYKKDKKTIIYLPILIGIIIIAIFISIEIFSLATEKEVSVNDTLLVENTIEENSIIQNNKNEVENKIENKAIPADKEENKKESFVKDTTALKQINTKTRKTASGKKYTSIGLVNIPSLGIKYQILSETSAELLKISVNKYWGANPNEVGNMCILGHNYKNSKFFGNLPKIRKGAKVYITDLEGRTLTYKVYETKIITEDDLSCTSQKTDGKTEITLITCYYEPGDKHASKRFIAKARVE